MFDSPEERKIIDEIQTTIASIQVDLASMIANCNRIIDRQPCFNPPKTAPVGVNEPSMSMAVIRNVHDKQLEIAPVAASQPKVEQDLASVPASNAKVDKNGYSNATVQSSNFSILVDNEGTSSPKNITPTVFDASSAIVTIAPTHIDEFESSSTREYLCLSELGYISFLQSPLQRNFIYNHFKKVQCQSLMDRVPDPKASLLMSDGIGRGPHVMVKINTKAIVTIYSLVNLDGRPPPALISHWKYNLPSLIQYVLEQPRTGHQAALASNGVNRMCFNVARLFTLSRPCVELQNNAPKVKLQIVLSNCLSLVDSILIMAHNYAGTSGNHLDGIITVHRASVGVSIRVICMIHNIQVAFLIFGLVLVSAAKDEFLARLDVPIAWELCVANRNRKALNEIFSSSDCTKSIGMVLVSSSFSRLHSMNFSHLSMAVHIHFFKCPMSAWLLKSLTAMVVDLLGFLPVVFKGGTTLPKVLVGCQLLVVISGNRVVQSKASTPTAFDFGGGVFVVLCLFMKNDVCELMVLVDDAHLGKSLYDRDSGIYYGQLYQILADPITRISPMSCLNVYGVLIFLHKLVKQSSIMQILDQQIYGDDDVHCLLRNLNVSGSESNINLTTCIKGETDSHTTWDVQYVVVEVNYGIQERTNATTHGEGMKSEMIIDVLDYASSHTIFPRYSGSNIETFRNMFLLGCSNIKRFWGIVGPADNVNCMDIWILKGRVHGTLNCIRAEFPPNSDPMNFVFDTSRSAHHLSWYGTVRKISTLPLSRYLSELQENHVVQKLAVCFVSRLLQDHKEDRPAVGFWSTKIWGNDVLCAKRLLRLWQIAWVRKSELAIFLVLPQTRKNSISEFGVTTTISKSLVIFVTPEECQFWWKPGPCTRPVTQCVHMVYDDLMWLIAHARIQRSSVHLSSQASQFRF